MNKQYYMMLGVMSCVLFTTRISVFLSSIFGMNSNSNSE